MPNLQPISKLDHQPAGWLQVHSIFATMQGEGPFAGHPAIFVRLGGCNLQCPACDTDYTTKAERINPLVLVADVMQAVPVPWCKGNRGYDSANNILVVITGGEPFRQNLVPFVSALIKAHFNIQIETNGTLWNKDMAVLCKLHSDQLTIVCSPKTGRLDEGILKHAKYFKYILEAGQEDPRDGLPMSTMMKIGSVARPPAGVIVYVQPLDEEFIFAGKAGIGSPQAWELQQRQSANLQVCVESAMRFGYRLSVQTHKIANLP